MFCLRGYSVFPNASCFHSLTTTLQGGPEDTAQAEADKDVLDAIANERTENNGKISEERVVSWVQRKINSMPCRNQGYVLDGYPKIEDQAKVIFANPAGENPDDPDPELLPGTHERQPKNDAKS